MIRENLEQTRKNIKDACIRAGRDPESVTLIAVSKTKPLEDVLEAYQCGVRDFGENKVQEMCEKANSLTDVNWHMIGHLQKNKVKNVVGLSKLIHSVDTFQLAGQISDVAVKKGVDADILIEVNMAEEESKFGCRPTETLQLVRAIAPLPGVHIKGLMTVAPQVDDPEKNRKYFAGLRELAVDIQAENIDNVSMKELSMGMTGDYEVAVEEGATFVRVGTGIFGARVYSNDI